MGVKNPLISVFKSIFIHKILLHQKNSGKNCKKSKKSEKNPQNPRIFLRIENPYLGVNNPLISVFKSIFKSISSHTQKIRKNPKKSEKIRKNSKKSKKYGKIRVFFWGFKTRTWEWTTPRQHQNPMENARKVRVKCLDSEIQFEPKQSTPSAQFHRSLDATCKHCPTFNWNFLVWSWRVPPTDPRRN